MENGKRRADLETLEKIAQALNVSVDRLIGASAGSIINGRLAELDMTYTALAEQASVPIAWLQNIDAFIPGAWSSDNYIAYKWISQIAEALGLSGNILRAALARQEMPAYDNSAENPYGALEARSVGKLIKVPIIGTVTAGPIGLVYEDYQGEMMADASLTNGKHLFYLRVKGDSMLGDGILPGDLALICETPAVKHGALAMVIVDGEEGTVRRVYQDDNSVTLLVSSPMFPPRIFKRETMNNVRIVGEVKMIMRSY